MILTRRSFTLGAAALGAATAAGGVRAAPAGGMLDTIILGAGMAGLNTAWLLEQQGQKVMVLEARQRVGGRVFTLLDQPGTPEMGFNAMAAGYGRGIDAAKRAGVELYDVAPRYRAAGGMALVLDGKPLTREQWAASPLNPFPAPFKTAMPWEIVNKIVAAKTPLADWTEWTDPKNAALDVSLRDFLKSQGLSDPAITLAYDTAPYYGTSAFDVSALMLEFNDGFIKTQALAGPQSLAVKGGNSRLPMAMAKLLKGDLLLGKEAVGIVSEADAASVRCADGSTYRAKRIVCALPFAVMRRIKFAPGLSGVQAQAVATLGTQPLSAAFFTIKSRYWDVDTLNPSMWTDGFAGTVQAQLFGTTDSEVTGLMVQGRGTLARYWDRLGKPAALELITHSIEAARPAAKGQISPVTLHSWESEQFSAGAWAVFGPGQVHTLAPTMAAPAGRIHFCGEHTATGARGLEGALESSERVAIEVLSA
ncbi:monoamine oxidase [Sphingomonas vulcanisoli]|uniref:Monoamine oxidase n=1 Tax=Sphingomonas vulcanisoli TaxID=1658060 RepID=A0ABX0TVV7_9SPHN|nr:NAD(P)/FAD-dependent oxidoreductase [Sphingomonas vulcanisoli]NIJ08505.1 monoamine oxidase [Sphingomonas vulcanisoli]